MSLVSLEQIKNVEQEKLKSLAELDRKGLIVGAEEDVQAYVSRLKAIGNKIDEFDTALQQDGGYTLDGTMLKEEDRISGKVLNEAAHVTQKLFGFSIDWVPAFYVNPRFAWLFGGCAYYFFPECFSFLIIRESFKRQKRWFIYDREELLSHELSHTARMPLDSNSFEERFAYMTAKSRFRRRFGGVFKSQWDSFLLLGTTMLLLAAQMLQSFVWQGIRVWWFWGLLACVVAFLLARDKKQSCVLQNAISFLENRGIEQALPVLFRCTDVEVSEISALSDEEEWNRYLKDKLDRSLRWRVIWHRFGKHSNQGKVTSDTEEAAME